MLASSADYNIDDSVIVTVTVTVEYSTVSEDFTFTVTVKCPPVTIADQVLTSYSYIIGDTTSTQIPRPVVD